MSGEDYREIYLSIRLPILVLSPQHSIIDVNPTVEELTGKTREQLLGQSCCQVFHGSEHPPTGCPVEKLLREGSLRPVEMLMESLGHTFLVSVTPLHDKRGQLQKILHVSMDVTEHLEAERQLREKEAEYRLLADTAVDIVFVHDLQGRVTYVNRAGLEFLGLEEDQVLGTRLTDYVPEEYHPLLEIHRQQRLQGALTERLFELHVIDKQGQQVPFEVKTAPVTKDGSVVGVLVAARDVRERKLMHDQLLQAQKMEAVGRLSAGVAHDFNNLLTAVLGHSSLALADLDEGLDPRESLEQIHSVAEKAMLLTQRLLAFSRRSLSLPQVVDLNQLVADMGKLLRRVIGEDIELVVEGTTSPLPIKVDTVQFEQVVLNLAVNARDAMPQGGKLVIRLRKVDIDVDYASTHPGLKPGHYHELAVSDTGCGMSPEVRKRIFEPFFTTKEEGRGTGLGLSTVKDIVESSGGSLIVYSEPGKGSTFRILWPPAEEELESEYRRESEHLPGGSETILLVEDEEAVREVLRHSLEKAGYRVLVAGNGQQARTLLEQAPEAVDLLLCDIVLPGGENGPQLAERLRKEHPRLKVLFMSGYAGEVAFADAVSQGQRLLQKPFSLAELLQAVRQVIDD